MLQTYKVDLNKQPLPEQEEFFVCMEYEGNRAPIDRIEKRLEILEENALNLTEAMRAHLVKQPDLKNMLSLISTLEDRLANIEYYLQQLR